MQLNKANLISEKDFVDADIDHCRLITLHNANGAVAQFTNYGARWVSMWVPDRNGCYEDVVLGFDTISAYKRANEKYHGAIIGRVCGRISNAQFSIADKKYMLASNDVYGKPLRNHLHGGFSAFHNNYWDCEGVFSINGEQTVVFTYYSKDGDEGYPGNLKVKATYTLKQENTIYLELEALTDKETIVNMTNHAFFNLYGVGQQTNALFHKIKINASSIVECDSELIPTGKILNTKETNMDFSNLKSISDSLNGQYIQEYNNNKGFSIPFNLNADKNDLSLASELYEEKKGRRLLIRTNQPSMQVYTAYFMDGKDIGKYGIPYYAGAGIAMEPQGFPDAVNQPNFPSIIINKNDVYHHISEYKFTTDE